MLKGAKNPNVIFAYCPTCRKTLNIPFDGENKDYISTGGLVRYTYIHEGPNGEVSHALVLIIDQNNSVRRAEITDMCIETGDYQADFNVTCYCQECQDELEIPVGQQRFETSLSQKGFYKQSYVHGGEALHTILVLLDKERNVRRAETTNIHIDASISLTPVTPSMEKTNYTLLELYKVPEFSDIFDALLILDRRSKLLTGLYTDKERENLPTIVERLEEEITELSDVPLSTPSFTVDGQECVFLVDNTRSHCILGIKFAWKSHFQWLKPLLRELAKEEETPNTIGIEFYFRVLKSIGRKSPMEKLPRDQILYDILFSPLYSTRFTFKHEGLFDRIFGRLKSQFPNTADLFVACAQGEKSVLEVLNTDLGVEYYEEFFSLIHFVDRRNLF